MTTLFTALQQADSAFPSGSFAFSNGIEGLSALGVSLDRRGLQHTVISTLRHRWMTADWVALVHAYRAGAEIDAIVAIDAIVETTMLAEPLRDGSKRNGGALLTAHGRLKTPGAAELRQQIDAGLAFGHLAVVQGFLWRVLGMSEAEAVQVSAYSTVAGLVAAAVRLGRIGAVEAQAVVAAALSAIAAEVATPLAPECEIESFAPFIEIAAVRNRRAHLRLFAN